MTKPNSHYIERRGLQRFRLRAEAGFSAIEMLMVLGVMALLFTSMYRGFETLNRSYTAESVKSGVQQNARIGIEFMVHDLRMAGLDPLNQAGAGFVTATATAMQFTADTNYDGDTSDPFEDIRYELVGDRVTQTNHVGQETLLQNVSNLTFTYLNSADAVTTVPGNIRSVVISLTIERPSGLDQPVSRTYTTRVRCRNM